MPLRGGVGEELIEHPDRIIRHLDCQNETVCLNLDGEGEEGEACNLTPGKAYDRANVGIGQETELKPIRRDTLSTIHASAEHLLSLAELGLGVVRFKRAGDRNLHKQKRRPGRALSKRAR